MCPDIKNLNLSVYTKEADSQSIAIYVRICNTTKNPNCSTSSAFSSISSEDHRISIALIDTSIYPTQKNTVKNFVNVFTEGFDQGLTKNLDISF